MTGDEKKPFAEQIRSKFAESDIARIKQELELYRRNQLELAIQEAKERIGVEGRIEAAGDFLARKLDFIKYDDIAARLSEYNSCQKPKQPVDALVKPGPAMLFAIEKVYRSMDVYMYKIEESIDEANKLFVVFSDVRENVSAAKGKVSNFIDRIKKIAPIQALSDKLKQPIKDVKETIDQNLEIYVPDSLRKVKHYPEFLREVVRQYAILLAHDVDEMTRKK